MKAVSETFDNVLKIFYRCKRPVHVSKRSPSGVANPKQLEPRVTQDHNSSAPLKLDPEWIYCGAGRVGEPQGPRGEAATSPIGCGRRHFSLVGDE
jgi:hypothetical protein